jgi:hypothetical protein
MNKTGPNIKLLSGLILVAAAFSPASRADEMGTLVSWREIRKIVPGIPVGSEIPHNTGTFVSAYPGKSLIGQGCAITGTASANAFQLSMGMRFVAFFYARGNPEQAYIADERDPVTGLGRVVLTEFDAPAPFTRVTATFEYSLEEGRKVKVVTLQSETEEGIYTSYGCRF